MDFKKLAVGVAFFAAATPALAGWWSNDELYVKNADTYVKNVVDVKADTGDNEIGGKYVGGWFGKGPKMVTGDASAYLELSNVVNATSVAGCGCFDDVTVKNWDTTLKNYIDVKADTGDNEMHGYKVTAGKIKTGNAAAAAVIANVVNTMSLGDFDVE